MIPELILFAGLFMVCVSVLLLLAEEESTAETADRQETLLDK